MTIDEAKERSLLIKAVQYNLNLVLPPAEHYNGCVEIKFLLVKPGHIFVDYSGEEIGDVIFNETRLDAAKVFLGHRIRLPKQLQIAGQNTVILTLLDFKIGQDSF